MPRNPPTLQTYNCKACGAVVACVGSVVMERPVELQRRLNGSWALYEAFSLLALPDISPALARHMRRRIKFHFQMIKLFYYRGR